MLNYLQNKSLKNLPTDFSVKKNNIALFFCLQIYSIMKKLILSIIPALALAGIAASARTGKSRSPASCHESDDDRETAARPALAGLDHFENLVLRSG